MTSPEGGGRRPQAGGWGARPLSLRGAALHFTHPTPRTCGARPSPSRGGSNKVVPRRVRTRHCEEPTGPARSGRPDDRLRDEAIQPIAQNWIASLALAMTKQKRSRGAFAPEFCSTKNEKLRTRSRRMAAGGGTGSISIAPGSQKNQEGGTPTDAYVQPPHPQPSSSPLAGEARRASSGTRSPVGVPPRRLRQRTNAAAPLQHALPGTRPLSGVT